MWAKTALCDQEDESVRRAVKMQRYFAFYAVTFHAIYTIASPTFDRSQLPGPPNGPGRTVSLNSMDTVFFLFGMLLLPLVSSLEAVYAILVLVVTVECAVLTESRT